ncbi:MAG: hypothetical protein K6G88_05610 [Lachnospiraceae bacterium]|nr:hypothetical protein [Lachnospiraceae bacterium]
MVTRNENVLTVRFNGKAIVTTPELTQYDTGQVIQFEDIDNGVEVHFTNEGDQATLNKIIIDQSVTIPDSLLETGKRIVAYVYMVGEDSSETIKIIHIPIRNRIKPDDYIAPEDEQTFREQMEQIMEQTEAVAQSVRDDADAGRFNGKDGEMGPQGNPGKTPEKYVDYFTPEDVNEVREGLTPDTRTIAGYPLTEDVGTLPLADKLLKDYGMLEVGKENLLNPNNLEVDKYVDDEGNLAYAPIYNTYTDIKIDHSLSSYYFYRKSLPNALLNGMVAYYTEDNQFIEKRIFTSSGTNTPYYQLATSAIPANADHMSITYKKDDSTIKEYELHGSTSYNEPTPEYKNYYRVGEEFIQGYPHIFILNSSMSSPSFAIYEDENIDLKGIKKGDLIIDGYYNLYFVYYVYKYFSQGRTQLSVSVKMLYGVSSTTAPTYMEAPKRFNVSSSQPAITPYAGRIEQNFFTSAGVTKITINTGSFNPGSGLSYTRCFVYFTAGANCTIVFAGTYASKWANYYGDDCANNVFTPVQGKMYRLELYPVNSNKGFVKVERIG